MATSGTAAPDPTRTPVIDSESVLSQLEHILESPSFRNSKRYPRFLRFIVEQALLGHADNLKERLLGIEVFDRPVDYDVTSDPIVRVAAGEIRKRLAQYYVEAGHENELRIQLRAGTYAPEFWMSQPQIATSLAEDAAEPATAPSPSMPLHQAASHGLRVIIATAGTVTLLAAVLTLYWVNRPTPVDQFWKPFLNPGSSAIICLGDITPAPVHQDKGEVPGLRTGAYSYDHVALADVEAMNRVSAIFAQHNKHATVSNSGSETFASLRQQPAVLIGGGSNQWTLRAMQLLRYQIVVNLSTGVNGIRDRNDSKLHWMVNFKVPYDSLQREYALVARFRDPTTDQPTMIIAGVGANGTVAAAEFLSTPSYIQNFIDHAPRG